MKDAKINTPIFKNPFNVATVVDNNDPENAYRVKVRIDVLHENLPDDQLPWAARVGPTFMGFGNADIDHAVPEVGTKVLTIFVADDPNSILYLGSLYKKNAVTPSGGQYLGSYGIYTKNGDFIGIDKLSTTFKMIYEGKLDISKITDAKITVNGPLTIKTSGNTKIESSGNVNIEASSTVEIKSGPMTKITGGVVQIEKGTQCGFNCLQKCILTNTPHVMNVSA